jgi:two-component system osmolarity sensor histidine kinase EnvZ
MRIWPRTLLWRTVLLLAILMIVGHLVWLNMFRLAEREPRARRWAQQLTSMVVLTRAALITAQPGMRLALLEELSYRQGIRVYLGSSQDKITPLPDSGFLELIATYLKDDLGADTRFTMERNGVHAIWVSFTIDSDEYWMMVPRTRFEGVIPWKWVIAGLVVLILSVGGAYLIVARINRPLRQLTRAALKIGAGRRPEPLPETGPMELGTLSRAFNQMTSDLNRAEDDRALLLAGISHDLRTPLSRLRLSLEMLDNKIEPVLKAGMVEDIDDIDVAIGQFLDFARVHADGPATETADLNQLVTAAAARYEREGKPVAMQLGKVPFLRLNPVLVQRLLANLIGNAWRHGGGDVEVATWAEDGHATVAVCDRGPGIPRADTERMLQPFTRLDTARGTSGTGLGLAIVNRIAQLHDGRVRLLARTGGGLEVRVELPLTKQPT